MSDPDDESGPDDEQLREGDEQPHGDKPTEGQPQGSPPQQGGQPQGPPPQQGGQPQGPPSQGPPSQQGGQPEQGEYRQPPQGRPPGGPGESPIQTLQRPVPKSFLKGIVATMAIGGVLLSLLAMLVGKIGGFTLLPGAVSAAEQMAGAFGPGGTTGQGGASAANPVSTAVSTTHDALMTYLSAELAPFIAFVLAVVFGVVIAVRMDEDPRTRLLTAGAGVFAGSFLFVLIVGLVASLVAPSVPSTLQSQVGAGTGSVAASGAFASLGELQAGSLLINAILVAILGAATAAATTFSIDRFFPA